MSYTILAQISTISWKSLHWYNDIY